MEKLGYLGDLARKEARPEYTDAERDLPGLKMQATDAVDIDRRWNKMILTRLGVK